MRENLEGGRSTGVMFDQIRAQPQKYDTVALGVTIQLTNLSAPIQSINSNLPNAAVKVSLPNATLNPGLVFIFSNLMAATSTSLLLYDDFLNIIATIASGLGGIVWSDGAVWRAAKSG